MYRAIILMYHMVSSPETSRDKRYACLVSNFRQQLRYLVESEFNVVSLEQLVCLINEKRPIPEKTVVITFDDGFEDNYLNAYPALLDYGLPATIFLATGLMEGANEWMLGKGYSERRMLRWSQVKEMVGNQITFGSHTVSHSKLTQLSAVKVKEELEASKFELESRTDAEATMFAYPHGLHSKTVRDLVEEVGYQAACTTMSGFNRVDADLFSLRRIEIYGTDGLWRFKQKVTFGTNDSSVTQPIKYYVGRVIGR